MDPSSAAYFSKFSNRITKTIIPVTQEQITTILKEALLRDFPGYGNHDIKVSYRTTPVYCRSFPEEIEVGQTITAEITLEKTSD